MINLGDRAVGSTLSFDFPTHKADGTPITLSGSPVISVYKNSTTESTSGVTLTVDYDSRTGMNHVVIDTSANGTFYATGNDFSVVITTGTVDSISQVGVPVAHFSIGLSNIASINSIAATSVATINANQGTTQPINFTGTSTTAYVKTDMVDILGTAVSTPATAGILDVNVKNMNNVAATAITAVNANQGTTQPVNYTGTGATAYVKTDIIDILGTGISTPATAGVLDVNIKNIANAAVSTSTAQLGVNAVQIGAAVPGSATIGTVTTVTNQLAAAAIATGVWQDATANDFTTASSIGKALYVANVAPGASGGHMISGSNAGTTTLGALTVTGATTLTGAVTATNASNDINGCNVQKINSQSVTASAGITANANLGTTQPINFTGTGATAYVKSDTVDIAGAAVSTSTAQIGVNAVNIGGTAQAGRDICTSVLLSPGTGTGQLDVTGGVVKANVTQADGVSLVTHGSGMIPSDIWDVRGTAIATPATAGILDVNMKNIANSAVSTGSAQIGVNVVQLGTTVVTGRDIGASVLISSGGGTGQLDVTGGVVKANVTQADGVALGTHASGILPADIRDIMGSAVSTSTAQLGVNAVSQTSGLDFTSTQKTSIENAVWDAATSGHQTTGSTGKALTSAASAGDPWTTSLPGAYGAGTAGKILGTNLDAKASDIKTQTDKMQFDVSNNIKSVKNATTAGTSDFNATEKASITTACTASTPTVTVSGTMDSNVIKVDGVALSTHASGMVPADARDILGTTISTPATAGILDVNAKNINNVATTSVTTINANQGTTQPVNFTGTGATAYVKSDVIDIEGADATTTIENTVWDAATSGHQTAGTTGKALTSAASAGDPWTTALPGAYIAGTAGYILGTNLNAKVGDVKTQTDKMTFTTTGIIDANMRFIDSSGTAAQNLALSAASIKNGTVDNTNITPTSTIFDTSLTEALTNHWKNRWIIFITGSLAFCASPILGYQFTSGKGRILCAAFPQAPANGDAFIIV
jgi:hypothetical protein